MAELGEENKVSSVFGGVEITNNNQEGQKGDVQQAGVFGGVKLEQDKQQNNLPIKTGFWTKFKAFWLQDIDLKKEIKVELTPYQQKVEDEVNEFLHQEITWKKIHNFLFQDISFGKKQKERA